MNNRIMAMLFALVAAMFISIVPVKAEAADVCQHTQTEWKNDQYMHRKVCKTCGVTLTSGNHDNVVFTEKDAATHTRKCKTCNYTETLAHNPQKDENGVCRCVKCGKLVDHTYEMVPGDVNHAMICKICGTTKDKAKHEWNVVDNGDGTHTKTCTVCEKVVANEACSDVTTDKDCACDVCKASGINHSLIEVAGKAATCTEAGVSGHKKCEFCGELYSKSVANKKLTAEDVVIEPLGHKAWTGYQSDETGHWHGCQNTGCEEKLEFTAHVPGEYDHDPDQHWTLCSECGYALEKVDHTLIYEEKAGTDTHDVKCEICGRQKNPMDCKDEDKDCFCDDCNGLMNHNKGDMKYLCVAPTCTESGWWENWLCETCGTRFNKDYAVVEEEKVFRPATGHALNAKWEETEDGMQHYQWCAHNCGEKLYGEEENVKVGTENHVHGTWYDNGAGYHCEVCDICGIGYNDAKHDYKEVVSSDVSSSGTQRHLLKCECGATKNQVCTFNDQCVCKVCGAEKIHDIAKLSTVPGAKDATCTIAGVKTHYECKTCKSIFFYEGGKCVKITKQDTVIPAKGHKWVPDTEREDVDGRHVVKCEGCNKITFMTHYTNDDDCYCDVPGCNVIAHSHKRIFVAGKEATCTEPGTEAYYKYEACGKMFDLYGNAIAEPVTTNAKGHALSDEWVPGEDGKHIKACANCDYFEAEDHRFANGNVSCTVCGGEESLTHVAAKAATCTENGNVEYWTSKVTGKKYADAAGSVLLNNVVVEATGHEMSGWKDAADGKSHTQVCMNGCGHELTGYHDNANGCFCTQCGGFKDGHSMTMVKMVPATCNSNGVKAHFECSCGKLYDLGYNLIEKAESIPALDHDYAGAEVRKDQKAGKHYVACNICGNKVYEEHVMVVEDPLKGNYHQKVCECGELEIETHYDNNGDNKCDVCGHSISGNSITVEEHDNKTVYTGEADTVQPTKSWWQNWQNWFTPSNSGGTTSSTEKVTQNQANTGSASTGNAATGNTANSNANTGSSNTTGGTTASGSTSASTGSASGSNTSSTPTASQTNVIVGFINWLFGLFGF